MRTSAFDHLLARRLVSSSPLSAPIQARGTASAGPPGPEPCQRPLGRVPVYHGIVTVGQRGPPGGRHTRRGRAGASIFAERRRTAAAGPARGGTLSFLVVEHAPRAAPSTGAGLLPQLPRSAQHCLANAPKESSLRRTARSARSTRVRPSAAAGAFGLGRGGLLAMVTLSVGLGRGLGHRGRLRPSIRLEKRRQRAPFAPDRTVSRHCLAPRPAFQRAVDVPVPYSLRVRARRTWGQRLVVRRGWAQVRQARRSSWKTSSRVPGRPLGEDVGSPFRGQGHQIRRAV
jgi:hypothetical protein